MTDKQTKLNTTLYLQDKQPLTFGNDNAMGIRLDGLSPQVVSLDEFSADDLWIHDENDRVKASMLSRFFDSELPRPFGVFYSEERTLYEEALAAQIDDAIASKGHGDLDQLLRGTNTWTID